MTATEAGGELPIEAQAPGLTPMQRAKAILGGFNGGQGLFQVNQVPGSDNIVSNSLILNLTVYNVSESQAPAVMQSLKLLAPAF